MRFVRISTLAGEVRGAQMAQHLGVPCDDKFVEARSGEWVVFVKKLEGVKEAKAAGAMIAFDPVDLYCYGDYTHAPVEYVDLVIVPSKQAAAFYKPLFPNAGFMIVPHQWDARITGMAPQDKFRPGYVGMKFNLREDLPGLECVFDKEKQLEAMPLFNCHVSDKNNKRAFMLKQATKIASAAAVGANIVTFKDPAAFYLLGDGYPFYTTTTILDGLFKAKNAFGTQMWENGLKLMEAVKHKTSIDEISKFYRVFM